MGLVAAEVVTDRASMVRALRDAGLEVTRESKDSLPSEIPRPTKFRMKGRIYEKDWTYDRELDRAIAPKSREPDSREREDHQRRTREAVERYKAAVERRSSKIQTDIAGRSLSISEDLNTLSMISRRWMIAGGR